jgi:hypothetical protein
MIRDNGLYFTDVFRLRNVGRFEPGAPATQAVCIFTGFTQPDTSVRDFA